MTVTMIPLAKLRLSPLNVRRGKVGGIDQLAADIDAHGLLQNLLGYEEDGKVMIFAGGRRYRALKHLQKGKAIPASHPVPVDLRPIEEAVELSLAENIQREDMHVADALVAYRALIEAGRSVEDIAARFGVALDHVRRVLKLAGLHPDILAALRRDDLGMAAAQAYALTDDSERQLAAFKRAGDNAHHARSLLTEGSLRTSSAMFQLVGENAYLAAGGSITRDLFSASGDGYADRPDIVTDLAEAHLETLAREHQRAGWKCVATALQQPDNFYALHRIEPEGKLDPDEAQAADLARIGVELAELQAEGAEYYDARVRELERERGVIEQALAFYTDEQKVSATLHIFIGHRGIETVAVGKAKRRADLEGDAPVKERAAYPASLQSDLAAIRTLAVREAVARDHKLAMTVLIDAMLGQVLYGEYSHCQAMSFRCEGHQVEVAPDLMTASTIEPIEPGFAKLAMGIPGENRLAQIAAMEDDERAQLLAHMVASQIDSRDARGRRARAITHLANAAGVDMAERWQPTVEFFARLSKRTMLQILRENCGESAAANCATMKKDALALACTERLDGKGYIPPVWQIAEREEEVPDDDIEGEDIEAEEIDDEGSDDISLAP